MAEETKQELINAAKTLPPPESFSLRPRTFDEAFRFANLIAESTLIPKEFQKQPANVLIAVQLGMELGVSPMQALQNIYVINGKPAIYGDLLPAVVLASGLLEQFDETGDEKSASCTVKRKGMPPITRTFSMAEAEKAGLPNRNPTYKSYPKRMLQMRARAYAFRDMFADLLKGVAIKEDIEDIEPRDVTPEPAPVKELAPLPPQKITEPMAKKIYTAAQKHGVVDKALETAIWQINPNWISIRDVTRDKYDEIMSWIESGGDFKDWPYAQSTAVKSEPIEDEIPLFEAPKHD